jgi:hypothetical protein
MDCNVQMQIRGDDQQSGWCEVSRHCREERVSRQEADHGDPESTVFIARWNAPTYHDNEDCQYLQLAKDDPRPITRRAAWNRWFAPCCGCVEGVDTPATKTESER